MTLLDALTSRPQNKRILAEKLSTTPREVELLVQDARLRGIPIWSDSDGYRYCLSADEARLCAQRLRNRAIRQLLTSRALRRAAQTMAAREQEQASLWDADAA